jgi:glycosyltransferase involved in cell wall biosynthesis
MTKTILLFTESHSFCGVGQFIAALLSSWCDAGYRTVCAQRFEETPLQERLKKAGVAYHWFDYNPESDILRFANDQEMALRIFTAVQPDLIYFVNGSPLASFGGISAAQSLSIPYVILEELVSPANFPTDQSELNAVRHNYKTAQAVICVSHQNLNVMKTLFDFPDGFGRVIPNTATSEFFRPTDPIRRQKLRTEWGVPEKGILCFTAAKLEPVKGHEVQLDAMEHLKSTSAWDQVRFAWAGQGRLFDKLSTRIANSDTSRHVTLLGHVWNMAELLDAADMFILTSHAEGMPLTILEAMAKSLPIIATDVGGNTEALSGCGKIIDPPNDTSPLDLAHAIEAWVYDINARKQAGAAGHARAVKYFSETSVLPQHVSVIENIVGA